MIGRKERGNLPEENNFRKGKEQTNPIVVFSVFYICRYTYTCKHFVKSFLKDIIYIKGGQTILSPAYTSFAISVLI